CSKCGRGCHIVSAIEQKLSDSFQAAGPDCSVDASSDGACRKPPALGRADSNGNVIDLMAAGQTRPEVPILADVQFEIALAQRADLFFKISRSDQTRSSLRRDGRDRKSVV